MHSKSPNAAAEAANRRVVPVELSRAPSGLPAIGDRAPHGGRQQREAAEKIHPALFGRLDSVDPAAIVERVA
jgi:hypothetical protein